MQEFSDWFDAKAQIQWTQEKMQHAMQWVCRIESQRTGKRAKTKNIGCADGGFNLVPKAPGKMRSVPLSLTRTPLFFLRDLYVPERKQASKQAGRREQPPSGRLHQQFSSSYHVVEAREIGDGWHKEEGEREGGLCFCLSSSIKRLSWDACKNMMNGQPGTTAIFNTSEHGLY